MIIEVEQKKYFHAAPELHNTSTEQITRAMKTTVDTGLIVARVMKKNKTSLIRILDETVELHHNINISLLKIKILHIIIQRMVAKLPL